MSGQYQAYPDAPAKEAGVSAAYPQAGYSNAGAGYNNNKQYGGAVAGPSAAGPYSPNLSPHFTGTLGMLLLLSLFLLYEGCYRVMEWAQPVGPYDNSQSDEFFPGAPLLIGAIIEVLLALMTFFIAAWAMFFDYHSVALTTITLGTQFVGWYTVIIFALAQPGFTARHSSYYNASIGVMGSHTARAAYTFGWALSQLFVCGGVLAALHFFTIQLSQIQLNNVDELHTPHYYGRRLGFWSALQLAYGICTIIFGGIVIATNTQNQVVNTIFFYPNILNYAPIVLVTGILFTLAGVWGLFASCSHNLRVSNSYIGFGWLTIIYVVAVHVLAQGGVFGQANYGPLELLSAMGVLIGLLFTGMFLAYKAATIEMVARGPYVVGGYNNAANRPVVV